jgi:hypothetical protein
VSGLARRTMSVTMMMMITNKQGRPIDDETRESRVLDRSWLVPCAMCDRCQSAYEFFLKFGANRRQRQNLQDSQPKFVGLPSIYMIHKYDHKLQPSVTPVPAYLDPHETNSVPFA